LIREFLGAKRDSGVYGPPSTRPSCRREPEKYQFCDNLL
jgi:hypothetical protein